MTPTAREARLSPAGCAIFVTESELSSLGIDAEATDSLEYRVTRSGIELTNTTDDGR